MILPHGTNACEPDANLVRTAKIVDHFGLYGARLTPPLIQASTSQKLTRIGFSFAIPVGEVK
jgi:hypothetical protein